ncbi:hypothetical protein [Carnobacterium iners]|uniref:hypothetical protein n=1 Tax=Carnobacterium iners TaxID=1073423 RepID=UPI000A1CD30D|nr:hypothetical protein [Carnobacterium iners]
MHWQGLLLCDNTQVRVLETVAASISEYTLSGQMVALGAQNHLTSRFRLVTVQNKKRKTLQFIANHFDCSPTDIAEMHQSR